MFSGDLPVRDEPLPRFIDDAAATKLLQAARATPTRSRACGRVPRPHRAAQRRVPRSRQSTRSCRSAPPTGCTCRSGKLRTDRYIPLHPQLKDLLDDWVARRPADLREPWLFIEHGRRIGHESVDRAWPRSPTTAGIGHVTPHQLRHTLATQAINRGMSLEAIAALLGHKIDADDDGLRQDRQPHRRR